MDWTEEQDLGYQTENWGGSSNQGLKVYQDNPQFRNSFKQVFPTTFDKFSTEELVDFEKTETLPQKHELNLQSIDKLHYEDVYNNNFSNFGYTLKLKSFFENNLTNNSYFEHVYK